MAEAQKFTPELMSNPPNSDTEKLQKWHDDLGELRKSYAKEGWDVSVWDEKIWLLERTIKHMRECKWKSH